MRIALDTDVLVYSEAVERAAGDLSKIDLSRRLIRGLGDVDAAVILAAQTLAELHNVLVKRARRSPDQASDVVRAWIARTEITVSGPAVIEDALTLAGDHGLQIFDAIILAAAVEARCDLLLSEDLQDGFSWRGVAVTNPFGAAPDRRIARLLGGQDALG